MCIPYSYQARTINRRDLEHQLRPKIHHFHVSCGKDSDIRAHNHWQKVLIWCGRTVLRRKCCAVLEREIQQLKLLLGSRSHRLDALGAFRIISSQLPMHYLYKVCTSAAVGPVHSDLPNRKKEECMFTVSTSVVIMQEYLPFQPMTLY